MRKLEFIKMLEELLPEDAVIFHLMENSEGKLTPLPLIIDGTEKLLYFLPEVYYVDKVTGLFEPEELAKKYTGGREPDQKLYTKIVVI
jgi:hypothetical protein